MISKQKEWSKPKIKAVLSVFLLIGFAIMLGGCAWIQEWLNPKLIDAEEAGVILDAQADGAEMYRTLREQGDPEAAQKTAEGLASQPSVKEASVSEDGIIWIEYGCGLVGALFPCDTACESQFSMSRFSFPVEQPVQQNPLVNANRSISSSVTFPGNKKIIALAFNQVREPLCQRVGEILESARLGYTSEIYTGEKFTVKRLGKLNQYGIIYMNTHGGVSTLSGWSHTTWISTGEKVTKQGLKGWWNEMVRAGRDIRPGIGIATLEGDHYFMVNQRFINTYKYPDSLIYIDACRSFEYDSLANAFLNNGAAAYFGWTEDTWEWSEGFNGVRVL